jgi:hypothetical protein
MECSKYKEDLKDFNEQRPNFYTCFASSDVDSWALHIISCGQIANFKI